MDAMKHDDLDDKRRKARDMHSASPIPGDPFPWEPAPPPDNSDDQDSSGSYPIDLGGSD
jgi:hypothetical protein